MPYRILSEKQSSHWHSFCFRLTLPDKRIKNLNFLNAIECSAWDGVAAILGKELFFAKRSSCGFYSRVVSASKRRRGGYC